MIHDVQFEAMGTEVVLAVAASEVDSKQLDDAFARTRASIHRDEIRWSRFLPNSEISRLAHSAGSWVEVETDTLELLNLALVAYDRTRGLFHPALGGVMNDLGYHRSFHDGLDADEIATHTASSTHLAQVPFELDVDRRTVRLKPNFAIDLGGIAKGYIAERAADVLRKAGFENAVCSAGGDMICHGSNEGESWTVGIDNPFDTGMPIGVSLRDEALATSGTYKRAWRRGEDKLHHMIDPRTAMPSTTDVVSCTVCVPRLTDAEVFAKTCLLLGTEDGIPWLHEQGCHKYVVVDRRGEVIQSWKS